MTLVTIAAKAMATDTISLTNYNELANNVNELTGRAGGNHLVNGDFEHWRLGGPWTANGDWTAVRWVMAIAGGGATLTISQETTTVAGGDSALKAVVSGSPSTSQISQPVEHVKRLRGKTIALSVRVHQSVASQVTTRIVAAVGSTASGSTSVTTGAWVTLTQTYTVDAAETSLSIQILFNAAGTYYVDHAMLVEGPTPTAFVAEKPGRDLLDCQRYYEVLGGTTSSLHLQGYQAAGQSAGTTLHYKATKAGIPTLTKNGTWTATNCGQPSVGGAGVGSCCIEVVVTALGAFQSTANGSDDTVTVEYN